MSIPASSRQTVEHRDGTYEIIEETEEVSIGGRVGRALASPLTAIAYAGAKIGEVFGFVSEATCTKLGDKCLEPIVTGNYTKKKYGKRLPTNYEKTHGVNAKSMQAIQEHIDLAHDEGRLLHSGVHQYVLLKNSAAIIIPDGDRDKAHVFQFNERESKKETKLDEELVELDKPFNDDQLEKVVIAFLKAYTPLDKQGAFQEAYLIIDFDTKRVRGFGRKLDPNETMGALGVADKMYDIDGSVIDGMRALWDTEKTEGKIPTKGTKVEGAPRKRKEKEKQHETANKTTAAASPFFDFGPPFSYPRADDHKESFNQSSSTFSSIPTRRAPSSATIEEESEPVVTDTTPTGPPQFLPPPPQHLHLADPYYPGNPSGFSSVTSSAVVSDVQPAIPPPQPSDNMHVTPTQPPKHTPLPPLHAHFQDTNYPGDSSGFSSATSSAVASDPQPAIPPTPPTEPTL